MRPLLTLLFTLILPLSAAADDARIAVAANFNRTAQEIAGVFQDATGHRVRFSFGSTGQLFAQISQGAPYDAFLSADRVRAERAVAAGYAVPDSRFTYALGRLVLFSRREGITLDDRLLGLHQKANFNKIAIANPNTAPYGAAAVEAMRALGHFERLESRLVRGNNIAQTYQFVYTGNARLGFVALSQVIHHEEGSRWIVPEGLHTPIAQDAVLLKKGAKNAVARAFLSFLKGPKARAIIAKHGYGTGD